MAIKTAILQDGDGYVCGIKWDGDGVKGQGKTIDVAVQKAVQEFYDRKVVKVQESYNQRFKDFIHGQTA